MSTATSTKADLNHPAVRRALWNYVGRDLGFDAALAEELEQISERFRRAAGWLQSCEFPEGMAKSSYEHVLDELLEARRVTRRAADTARGVAVLASVIGKPEDVA
jgi:hypothetical protein